MGAILVGFVISCLMKFVFDLGETQTEEQESGPSPQGLL